MRFLARRGMHTYIITMRNKRNERTTQQTQHSRHSTAETVQQTQHSRHTHTRIRIHSHSVVILGSSSCGTEHTQVPR